MNIKEVQRVVGGIQSQLFKKSNSYAIGMLKSHFRGTGLQFKEHRLYEAGDEVRFIDWKLLAKSNVPYVKTFEEERNVEIVVVVDASNSMLNGYRGVSKLQAAIEICCLLYLISKKSGDKIHVIIMGDQVINVPSNSGEEGIISLVATLEKHQILSDEGYVNIEYKYQDSLSQEQKQKNLLSHLARRKEVVLLSDFNDFLDESILGKIIFRNHVHCYKLVSPIDENTKLPFSLFTEDSSSFLGKKLIRANQGGSKDLEKLFRGRLKSLRIKQRYLEDFVKGML